MTILESLLLGAIQGITEFLPISSSGHLFLAQSILGINVPGNDIEIATHIGTLFSIIIVFRLKIKSLLFGFNNRNIRKYIFLIVIGTIPAVLAGLFGRSLILTVFESLTMVCISLIITGFILIISKNIKEKKEALTLNKAIAVGLAQAIAIIPGISRSGMTISIGVLMGLTRKEAANFSFLLAIPIITGAGLLTAIENYSSPQYLPFELLLIAFFSSFVVGFVSLNWLLSIVHKGKFYIFGYYCLIIGTLGLVIA